MSHHRTVKHKRDVVAHQHRGNVDVGIAEESFQQAGAESVTLHVHLKPQPVSRHESYLKP